MGWGLSPYQVASWSIQPFGHNRHGPKTGCGGCAPLGGGAESPSNTVWSEPRHTTVPSSIIIHPTIWPQYMNVLWQIQTDRTNRQQSDSIGRTIFTNGDLKSTHHNFFVDLLPPVLAGTLSDDIFISLAIVGYSSWSSQHHAHSLQIFW